MTGTLAAGQPVAGAAGQPVAGAAASPQVISVNGASSGRTFDGVGGLSAGATSPLLIDYPEPERSQILDYLFKPDYGASLQILKVEIGGGTNSTDGTEPSVEPEPGEVNCNAGYEWWLMEQAKQRNPDIKLYGLEWGAPGWVGGGQQTVWTSQNITYLLTWLGCAKQHGLQINYLGGWNERGFDATWYENLRAALNAHGYGYIKIVAADNTWAVADALSTDPAFAKAVDIVGDHYPCGWLKPEETCPSTAAAESLGKPLWASEQGSQPYGTGAIPLARAINREYVDGQMTGTINWALVWSAYDGLLYPGAGLLLANQPWSGRYVAGQSVWALAQTTQFTQPGWRYLDSGSERIPGGSVVSLRDPASGDWSSIAETLDATSPQQVDLAVSGGLSTGTVHVWATNLRSADPAGWFVHETDLAQNDGHVTATLQPGYVYTFTTTSGQQKGAATSPAASAWKLPYRDNFESYPPGARPRYFSDLGGTFATAPCQGGRTGMCLRSIVTQEPVRWISRDDFPLTVAGDPDNWHNYKVGVDAMLEQSGSVDLGGRVINGVSGYHLIVHSDGQWALNKVDPSGAPTALATGQTNFPVGTWHRFTLTLRALTVTAAIDGSALATVSDQSYGTGQVSLAASAWQNAEFDNLAVIPAPGQASKLTLHDVTPSAVTLTQPGKSAAAGAQVTNPGPVPATKVTTTLQAPQGWTVTPASSGPATLMPGDTGSWHWQLTAPATAAPGRYDATIVLHYTSGGQPGTVTRDLPIRLGVIPHAGMTATTDSTQGAYQDWCCFAPMAIDDNPSTVWHTQWDPYQPLPHEITLDLGADYNVSGLLYLPRQDGIPNGVITSYQVWLSSDGTHFTQVAAGSWADDYTLKSAGFAAQPARYVRLTALAGHSNYASAAEINVLGTPSS